MGQLTVVGIGPGKSGGMTLDAKAALDRTEILVGYKAYLDLIRAQYPDKPVFATAMLGEVERCKKALELACGGADVAVVCSGDAGVYGMAGLLYELSVDFPPVELMVVPGVTAALSGAAVLGAPLTHDFAVISLSDLLTPWALIEKRLRCAAEGDFSIALYNPASKKRADYLKNACKILMESGKSPDTLCGYVQNIGRTGEQSMLLPLSTLQNTRVDMFTTVFIGNAQTCQINGRMVTPRGYRLV